MNSVNSAFQFGQQMGQFFTIALIIALSLLLLWVFFTILKIILLNSIKNDVRKLLKRFPDYDIKNTIEDIDEE